MFRNVVASGIVVAAVACGGKSDASGPVYSPAIANALRAIAPDCKVEKTSSTHARDCTGRVGRVAIALDDNDRFRSLTISLKPMVLFEAKNWLEPPLEAVIGAAGRDKAILTLAKLQTGQSDKLEVGTAKIAIDATGTSKIAPAYVVTLTW